MKFLKGLDKDTEKKKVGNNSEFSFSIYWWILENPKNQNFKKMKKNCWRYHDFTQLYKSHNHMRYSCWDTEWGKFLLSFWVNFWPLHSFLLSPPNLTTQTTKILKKWKNHVEMSIFWTYPKKRRNKMMCIHTQIWSATDIIFCCFRSFFALLPHYWPPKFKFWKNLKDTWRYFSFTHAHHESRSYDVCLLRYKAQKTTFFVIMDHFLPLTLLTTEKIKILKK